MALLVWSYDEKEVDVMAAIMFLADVQRNITAVIAAAENVDTNDGV